MNGWELFLPADEPGGVVRYSRPDGQGGIEILAVQDTSAIVDANRAMRTHNDGYTKSRNYRRTASIPAIVEEQWIREGWYPHDKVELAKRLNSSDWAHLRTADGRLGVSNGIMR